MRIVIAGGTGFLGSALTRRLRESGHTVLILTRRARNADHVEWDPNIHTAEWIRRIDGADAVINLAGEPLDSGRWTGDRKARLLNSRIAATRALVAAIAASSRPPAAFISASAVGYYGQRGDEPLTETSQPGSGFLASICVTWEREALQALDRCRVVLLRTGLVLSRDGGALPPLALPFRFFAGGPAGSGNQWWSWIHASDWVGVVEWILESADVSGPVNVTAPEPVRNREFAKRLASVLRRPALVPAPAAGLRLLLGEMADALILSGQRVLPMRAMGAGYQFRFPKLDTALADLYGRV